MRPELVEATQLLRNDDQQSTERAIELLQNTVYSFSMKVCGQPQDAEDTMQEVLYRSLPHLKKIEEPKAMAVWLYTVTKRRCWRMRKKEAPATRQMLSLDELMPDEGELARMLVAKEPSPEKQAIGQQQRVALEHAVRRLPLTLRLVLVLHDMEELTTEEVARVLELQVGTVRVRLHRARLSLRKQLSASKAEAPKQSSGTPQTPPKKPRKRRPEDCRELFGNLSEYLDNRAGPTDCAAMREHIEGCPACVAFLKDLKAAIDRCRAMQPECDPAVAARLRSLLTQEYLRLAGSAA